MDDTDWILMIDDDLGIRETTRDILEARDYQIVTAASGAEGLELLSRADHDWSVALVDLVLPDLSGIEVIEKIQRLSPLTQVIMMTGYASVDSVVNGLRANIIDYLQKPVEIEHLIATIERAFEHRKRLLVEQKVRQAATEWRLTFDTIPDVILIIGPDSRVLRANQAGAELIGLPFSQLVGQPWYTLLGLTEDVWNLCPAPNGARDERRLSGEFYLQRFRRHFLIARSAIADNEATVAGMVLILRDITYQKQMQAKFLQTEKLAAVGQLAAGVAHEVNNPLSFIMTNLGQLVTYVDSYKRVIKELVGLAGRAGKSEMARQITDLSERYDLPYIDSDVSELMTETMNGLVRIRNIVADLRKLSYMDDEDAEEVDLNRLASSAANLVKNDMRLRGDLRLELGKIPTVHGVPGRLSQAILNILLNAAHALDENRRDQNLITVTSGQQGGQVFLRISDNGMGIPPEIIDRIFDPFFTTKRAGEGSGLGLAICQDIAHKHSGRIEVESKPGEGTAFTMWIPLDAPVAAPRPASSPLPPPDVPERKPRLLIVDDERDVLKSLNRVLSRSFLPTTANSAADALAILETDHSFDLILSDIVMGEGSGKSFYLEACRRWPELEPRFVFFTGGAFDQDLREFQTAMSDRTVHKPLKADELVAVISDRLRRLKGDQP